MFLNMYSAVSSCVRVSQGAAAERRGHPETAPPAGAEEAGVSEGRREQGGQAERAAAGVGEDRRRQQDAAQEAAGAGGCQVQPPAQGGA